MTPHNTFPAKSITPEKCQKHSLLMMLISQSRVTQNNDIANNDVLKIK